MEYAAGWWWWWWCRCRCWCGFVRCGGDGHGRCGDGVVCERPTSHFIQAVITQWAYGGVIESVGNVERPFGQPFATEAFAGVGRGVKVCGGHFPLVGNGDAGGGDGLLYRGGGHDVGLGGGVYIDELRCAYTRTRCVVVQIACGFAWAVRGSERLADRGFRQIGRLCTFSEKPI